MTEKQHIHQNISLRVLWYRLADACCIVVGLVVSLQYGMIASENQNATLAAIAILIYYLFAEAGALYRSWRGASIHRELAGTLACWSCTLLALLALGYLTDYTAEFSRISMLTWFAVTPGLIIIVRIATRGLQRILLSLGYRSFAQLSAVTCSATR